MYDWSEFEDNDRLLWAYENGQLYNRIGGKIINKLINLPTFCSQNLTIGSNPFCWLFVRKLIKKTNQIQTLSAFQSSILKPE